MLKETKSLLSHFSWGIFILTWIETKTGRVSTLKGAKEKVRVCAVRQWAIGHSSHRLNVWIWDWEETGSKAEGEQRLRSLEELSIRVCGEVCLQQQGIMASRSWLYSYGSHQGHTNSSLTTSMLCRGPAYRTSILLIRSIILSACSRY